MKRSGQEIKLSNGMITLVDDEDHPWLAQYNWGYMSKGGYARRSIRFRDGSFKTFLMHRLIMTCPDHLFVDHINHDGLDNRKANLRICTKAENTQHQRLRSNNTSGFKGVFPYYKKFVATCDCKVVGRYKTAEEAARAYDKRAKMLYGEFAVLNFPDENRSG